MFLKNICPVIELVGGSELIFKTFPSFLGSLYLEMKQTDYCYFSVSVMVVVLDNSNGQRFVDGLVQLILGGKIMSAVTDLNGEVLFALR